MSNRDAMAALASVFAEAASARDRRGDPTMPHDPERAIPALRDHLARWDVPCPFKVGDILKVAPYATIWKQAAGLAIVRDILPADRRRREEDHMVMSYDMSILMLEDNGTAREFDAHSRDFILHEKAAS